jgi:2'-5' RNA ligase
MMLRSFIAIELPPELQQAIARETAGLRAALPRPLVRWVAPENVHLTLKFLGDVSPANLELLAEALKVEALNHAPFEAYVGKVGAFPNPRRPRVIWVGFEAPAALSAVQRGVEAVCARLGYPSEERGFTPHLTIGRLGQTTSAADLEHARLALQKTELGILGKIRVDGVHIFKSDLRPDGPIYTHLHAMPFEQNNKIL